MTCGVVQGLVISQKRGQIICNMKIIGGWLLMILLRHLMITGRISYFHKNSFVLMRVFHGGMVKVEVGLTWVFQCMLLLIESQNMAVKYKTSVVDEVELC